MAKSRNYYSVLIALLALPLLFDFSAISRAMSAHRYGELATTPPVHAGAASVAETRLTSERSASAASSVSYEIANPYAVPGVFRKTQFHLHSHPHDGRKEFTPERTAHTFKRDGYGFVMYTDHDQATQFTGQNDDTFATATGYESTGDGGHIGAWFMDTVIDPGLPAQRRIDAIRQAGGIAALNHPDWPVGFTAEQLKELEGYLALEIYNHITTLRPEQLRGNLEKWRQVLNQKGPRQPVWGIAVSDTHEAFTGGGWTLVKTETVSAAALREAIVRGSMYGTTGPELRTIEVVDGKIVVEAAVGEGALGAEISRIRFIDQNGRTVHEAVAGRASYQPTDRDRWVRIEASDSKGRTAWSQPLWITHG
ncbi:MAG: hypothetical protein HY329_13350 [Chloroflexi bacterium]|nr:hypothetical protein [Chloroflexota bacterium]